MTPTQMRTGRNVEKSESRNVFLLILLRASKKGSLFLEQKKNPFNPTQQMMFLHG